jgi:hypothetical protein
MADFLYVTQQTPAVATQHRFFNRNAGDNQQEPGAESSNRMDIG